MISPIKTTPIITDCLKRKQDGFTLIEILIAIAIVSILMSVAVVNIPNNDARHWKNDTNHLLTLMNVAHEESLMNGRPLHLKVDQNGWNFFYLDKNGFKLNQNSANPASIGINESFLANSRSTQLPDIYKPQSWVKPVSIAPVELVLGEELFNEGLTIKISQNERKVTIYRNRYGHFELVNE